ncbi:MAG: helix-turn-helix domain-containing protein [Thermoguttaceae bacterium]
MSLSDELREAIRAYDGTVYAISKATGVCHPVIGRFLRGERDLYLATADKLAEFFGLGLLPKTIEKIGKAPQKATKATKSRKG